MLHRLKRAHELFSSIQKLRALRVDIPHLANRMSGSTAKRCSICSYYGPFRAFGDPPRWNAQCPRCLSLERHRHMALVLADGAVPRNSDILHFAAEDCVTGLLKPFAKTYTTADFIEAADLQLNIEAMDGVPDESYDVVVCSHVLEHVDDRRAMRELRRITRKDGLLLLMVPIYEGTQTYEDSSITSEEDRLNHFGQRDHVRIYGSDFRQRLASAGLSFEEKVASGRAAIDHALYMGDKIFICRRA